MNTTTTIRTMLLLISHSLLSPAQFLRRGKRPESMLTRAVADVQRQSSPRHLASYRRTGSSNPCGA